MALQQFSQVLILQPLDLTVWEEKVFSFSKSFRTTIQETGAKLSSSIFLVVVVVLLAMQHKVVEGKKEWMKEVLQPFARAAAQVDMALVPGAVVLADWIIHRPLLTMKKVVVVVAAVIPAATVVEMQLAVLVEEAILAISLLNLLG